MNYGPEDVKNSAREAYWDELTTDADRIERLRGIVEQQVGFIRRLREQVERLNHHQHSERGVPMIQIDLDMSLPINYERGPDYRVARGKPW